jgi:hypothetical protein
MEQNILIPRNDPPFEPWRRYEPQGTREPSRTADSFTADEVLAAFESGKSVGRLETQRQIEALIRKEIIQNMGLAAKLALQVVDLLQDRGYAQLGVFLRPDLDYGVDYELLIAVDGESFVTDEFDDIYDITYGLIRGIRTDTFRPSLRFLPVATEAHSSFDDKAILCDGYIYRLASSPLSGSRAS